MERLQGSGNCSVTWLTVTQQGDPPPEPVGLLASSVRRPYCHSTLGTGQPPGTVTPADNPLGEPVSPGPGSLASGRVGEPPSLGGSRGLEAEVGP